MAITLMMLQYIALMKTVDMVCRITERPYVGQHVSHPTGLVCHRSQQSN